MKFLSIKNYGLKRLMVIFLLAINFIQFFFCIESRNSITLSNRKSFNTQVQKYKFYFMLKLQSTRDDARHPLNTFSYKNVLLSTSQVVFFVSSNPNNSVIQ